MDPVLYDGPGLNLVSEGEADGTKSEPVRVGQGRVDGRGTHQDSRPEWTDCLRTYPLPLPSGTMGLLVGVSGVSAVSTDTPVPVGGSGRGDAEDGPSSQRRST